MPRFARWVAAAAVLGVPLATHQIAHADHDGPSAALAAQEIQDARDRADAAAQALFEAESRVDVLATEIAAAEQRLADLEVEVRAMRDSLSATAVRRFTAGGVAANPLLGSIADANTYATASILTSVANDELIVDVDDYDQTIDELDEAKADLERGRSEALAASDDFERLRAAAEKEITQLQLVEADRVRDAEVQHALERQRRERAEQEARERAEQEAREREEQEARERAEQEARRQAEENAAADSDGDFDEAPPTSGAPPTPPPPAPAPVDGLACPVRGAVGFSDTWGASRSGGRRHEGVDMIAGGGTPLVAVEAGMASFRTNRLGGNTVSLQGASGTRYYYAHLSSWEGSSRSVSRGEVLGYVGKTGNTTVNHLHLQVHPGGGTAVNPYPYARSAC